MSTAAAMQHVKAETTKPAQPTSQLATQSRHIESDATQNEFADLRPQAATQRKLQDAAKHSSQSRQFQALQQMTQNSARSIQLKTISAKMHMPALQRAEDDEPLQAKTMASTVQRETTAAAEKAPKPNNTGLPDKLKSGIESLSGMSMDHVKVHYNSAQPAQLNAHAYAQGSDIHVAPGQEQHLPHEAWHVVQQAQGRVQPTMQMKSGVPVNNDVGLEAEADVMGGKAVMLQAYTKDSQPNDCQATQTTASGIVQRVAHANNFEVSLLTETTAAAIPGAVVPALGTGIPYALTAGTNPVLDAQFNTAMAAARRMDETANPRANPLTPSGVHNAPVPGIGNVAKITEMDDIRTFLVAISGGPGIGAGVTPGGADRSVVDWGALHNEFGTYVIALLRPGGGQIGSSPSLVGAAGPALAFGGGNWGRLHHRKGRGGVTIYARGHLLHHGMGGPGLDYNLVPLTNAPAFGANSANLGMTQIAEQGVLDGFNDMWGVYGAPTVTEVNYRVRAHYGGHNRPMTQIVSDISDAYDQVLSDLEDLQAPLGTGGATPTHTQVRNAVAIPVGNFIGTAYPAALLGGVFDPTLLQNGNVITLANVPVLLGIAAAGNALDLRATSINGAAGAHVDSAMNSLTALGGGTAADVFSLNLAENAGLWDFEDDNVPIGVEVSFNRRENGQLTGTTTTPVINKLPDSAAAPYV